MSVSSLPVAPVHIPPTTTLTPGYAEVEALRYLNGPAANKANQLLGLLE